MDEFNLALVVLRVAVGLTMAAHGANKFKGGLAGVAGWFDGIGMRPGALHAKFAAGGEVLAGLFLALGLLTTFASFGFVALMTVAAVTTHIDKGFFILGEGWEYVFNLAVAAIVIAILGPGQWSLDDALGLADGLDGYVGLAISACGGLAASGAFLAVFYRPPSANNDNSTTT